MGVIFLTVRRSLHQERYDPIICTTKQRTKQRSKLAHSSRLSFFFSLPEAKSKGQNSADQLTCDTTFQAHGRSQLVSSGTGRWTFFGVYFTLSRHKMSHTVRTINIPLVAFCLIKTTDASGSDARFLFFFVIPTTEARPCHAIFPTLPRRISDSQMTSEGQTWASEQKPRRWRALIWAERTSRHQNSIFTRC